MAGNLGDLMVIQSESERGFWNNEDGWVSDITEASKYCRRETFDFLLPMTALNDAKWVVIEYWD